MMSQLGGNKKTMKAANSKIKQKIKPKNSGIKVPSDKVKNSIIEALSHSEAEDGLYFRNFSLLHEEDQRPCVKASTKDLLIALNQLLEEGLIKVDFDDLEVTFRLAAA